MNRFALASMDDATAAFLLTAMITFLSLSAIFSVVAVVLARAVATAPVGYEDHAGFHECVAEQDEAASTGNGNPRSSTSRREAAPLQVAR